MTRREQVHPVEESSFSERVLKGKMLSQRKGIDGDFEVGQCEERFYFGGECQSFPDKRVIKRLDPETVTAQQKAAGSRVPQREGEHAVNLANEAGSHLFV